MGLPGQCRRRQEDRRPSAPDPAEERQGALLAKVEANFKTVDGILAKYKTKDGGFETYDKVTDADRNALKGPVTTLAEDLSQLRGTLGLELRHLPCHCRPARQ